MYARRWRRWQRILSASTAWTRPERGACCNCKLLGHQAIGVTVGPVDVQMQGSTATVRFSVLLTGGGRWLPDQAQHYQVTTGWRLRGSDWELYHAQWTAGGG